MNKDWEFAHIGMVVKDLGKAVEFYKTLGFDPDESLNDLTIGPGELQVNGKPSTMVIKLKILNIYRGNVTLELIEPVAGEFVHMETLKDQGEGANHIGYFVGDLEAEKAKMVESGFPYIFGGSGFAFFDTRRVGNMIIELVQKD